MRQKKFGSAAEKQRAYREKQAALRLAAKVTKEGGNVTESVTISPNVTPEEMVWDREKFPVHRAWVIALERAERARKYAQLFPQFVHGDDVRFQDVSWQYVNEGIPACKQPEVKEKQ